ncbi:MAG: hypothetical protein KQH63_16070 [Desulfobulbaceae bacterium]|nr:hypothetical protein [Desulfobulbaceae bacterium]
MSDGKAADRQDKERSSGAKELETVTLKLRPDLYRAYHRCSWIIIHETGRDQLSIMEEMVEDFLIKHGC